MRLHVVCPWREDGEKMIDLWEEDDGVVGFIGLRMREREREGYW